MYLHISCLSLLELYEECVLYLPVLLARKCISTLLKFSTLTTSQTVCSCCDGNGLTSAWTAIPSTIVKTDS